MNKKIKINLNKSNKLYKRNSIITNDLIDQTIKIYNGIKFYDIYIKPGMVGYKFGEFAPTRIKKKIKKKK